MNEFQDQAPRSADGPALFGRRDECSVLDGLVAGARAGQGQALVLRGEEGLGKTALLNYLAGKATRCRVASVTGVASETDYAFGALHRLCVGLQDRMERLPNPQRDMLETAFGLRDGDIPDRFMVGLATLNLLVGTDSKQPLVCLVDNAQWLDMASAQALGFAARRLAPTPIVLVFAMRPSGTCDYLAGLPELVLQELSDEDARALLNSRLTGPLDPAVHRRMLAEACGNPRRLHDMTTGQTPEEMAGGFGLPAPPPAADSAAEAMRATLGTLAADARLVLLVAAAEPTGDAVLVWRTIGRFGVTMIPSAASGLVELEGCVRFRDHRARSVVYWAASAAERCDVHRSLAAGLDPQADQHRLAWHLALASRAPDEDVAAAIENSAASGWHRGGLAASAVFHEHAMMRTPEASRRARRALAAAHAKHLSGAPASARRLLAIAEAGPLDDLARGHAVLLRAQLATYASVGSDTARRLLRAAADLAGLDPERAATGYGEALHLVRAAGGLAGRGDLSEVAAAIRAARAARDPGSPVGLTEAMALLMTEGCTVGAPAVRQALATMGSEAGSDQLLLGCRAARDLWDHPAWLTLSGRLAEQARQMGEMRVLPAALQNSALAHAVAGDLGMAASLAREAESAAQTSGVPIAPYGSLAVAAWSGAQTAARRLIAAATGPMLVRDEGRWLTATAWATALAGNGLGQYDQALDAAEEGAAAPVGLGLAAWSTVELIEAATRLGRPERARGALDRLAEMATASQSDWARGLLARSQALLAKDADAEEHYRVAVSFLGRAGLRAELARARLLYGEWLRRRMRRLDAREQLREAHQMLATMGATGFAERARRELMATGESVRRRTPGISQALTDQETQIALLAADGFTNLEIGVKLFLSARTIEWHLRKIYIKLGVSSRVMLRDTLPSVPRLPALAVR